MPTDPRFLDTLPDALFLVRDGVVAWINEGARVLLGAPRDELVGLRLEELLAEGEPERLQSVERHRAAGWELPAGFRTRLVRRSDRGEVPVDLRVGRRRGEAGEELILSARDATEEKAAEVLMARLADLSARVGGMVEIGELISASGPIFEALGWVAALTEVSGQVAAVRQVVGSGPDPVFDYACRLLGVEAPLERYPIVTEVVRTGRPLFLDDLPTAVGGAVGAAVALSESMTRARLRRSVWVPIRAEEGITHVLSVSGPCLTEPDFVALQLFGAQLASALRVSRMRVELVRHERLAALGQMSAALAHEVRNPLGAIFNALGVLGRGVGKEGEAGGMLEVLWEESARLERLVEDLLDYSRRWSPRLRPVAVEPMLREALDSVRRARGGGVVEPPVEVEVPADLAPALADPDLLRRAVINLVVNAFQHVVPGGAVRLTARRDGDAWILMQVSNDGPPIPPESEGRLFEPFFTTRATGTGLGLALVRRIAESLGGSVEARSGPPVTFTLRLRRAPG